ncbi:protein Gawky isoform X1 [Diorhabda sublineata]|uniref:protein Gawky isoform X1 n=1 Tax=Diorhabda sublineata TaxID=1163346 RepID=UPI0024E0F40E|nr:protein Gawky isoform X1 [Diorhabda sublineata]XP_056642324.1 protein Gawky isoform X1 [Diorhabda sublineata]
MRAPTPSEPKTIFPTYQVPQKSAMRGSAPPVQVAGPSWGDRADSPSSTHSVIEGALSVISGSSCRSVGNSNIRMQSVTENCLLNSVTVPNMQRIDHGMVTHNNSFKLVSKFGALLPGRDIPNQKSDDLELHDNLNVLNTIKYDSKYCDNNDENDDYEAYHMSNMQTHTSTNDLNSYSKLYAPLRLRGGGESSLSTGTSGWGTPPTQQSGNNNANKSNGQQPPTSQSNNTGWGQPGTKPTNNALPPSSQPPTSSSNSQNNNGPTNSSTKQQLEQLNSMREAIFSQDGWGGQHVNQDTNWDIPSSPEPPLKMDGSSGPPPWKPAVNNGTELWEANLRNGGQPPPQPQQKTPWGHTPSTNIGGTWGEDDDADTSNVWTGAPSNQPQWGGASGNTNNGAMWGGPKKENDWGAGPSNSGAGWGDPRSADPRQTGMDPREIRPELRDMRTSNSEAMRIMDPRETMRQMSNSDMRGDPRGITGRLNGAGAEAFWGQGTPHAASQPIHHHNKMTLPPGNGTGGWEEPSPPSQRRNMPNYDDGTSLWGNPQQGSHWKDLPTGGGMSRGGNAAGPPGMSQNRGMKPDVAMWGGHGRNGSWDETGPSVPWDETSSWQKQKMPDPLWDESEWGHKQQNKPQLTKEMVWNSKQFRMLVDMGHKKEDVENALRMRSMNLEEALDLLSPMRNNRGNDGWNARHDDHYEHPPFACQRFPTGPGGQLSGFPPANNAPNLLNSMSNSGANNSLINNIAPAVVQKLLTQGGGSQGFGGSSTNAGRNIQPQSQPSTQQLRMLVQQIQMAVQAGYLNHQILNQPLAPQTLVLLNQLLQQIKTLQQLISQQSLNTGPTMNGKPSNTFMQFSVLITKTKQSIGNLQNQIAAQQATYVKQQQHQSGIYDTFKTNSMHDSINALQSNFSDLGINKEPQLNPQQSRLTQWINKDKDDVGEFSRAPGSVSKPLNTSPNMNPLVLNSSDGPWSTGRTGDTGWPDAAASDTSNDVKDAQWSTTTQPSLTDLVPEFEPGKPWKGNQIKSIEDDPSITPGSVVRSPLSIATIKDNELFNMNPSKSPPVTDGIQSLSLSSSTWSFNPTGSVASTAFTSPPNKLPTSKGALGDLNPTTPVTSELWGAPKSSRGPPPGLSAKGTGGLTNGWSGVNTMPWAAGGQRSSGNWGGSQWLLLRNLTAQIDGSTLRTLCLQHGPLLSFHLYLHQGFALAKYSSREEAIKAQTTLNNCVLGNTTILAENPTDWDANTLLQQVAASQQSGSSGAWRGSSKQPSGADTWSTGWPNNPTSTSLWAAPQLDNSDPARGTPSSLNSFLPNDLLGGESM